MKRGLKGGRLVSSDAHEGLFKAIEKVLSGTAWQRCRVNFMRNLLSTVPKGAQDAVAAIVRTVFSQPDHASAINQLHEVARMLGPKFPPPAALLEDAAEDVMAHLHFPRRAPSQAALDEPARAPALGDQAADPRRRDLPHPRLADADGRDAARRSRRRVAGRRPSLLQRRLDDEGGRALRT